MALPVQCNLNKVYAPEFFAFVLFLSCADDVGRPTFISVSVTGTNCCNLEAEYSRDRDEERGAAGAGLEFIKRVHKLRLTPSCPTQGWLQLHRVVRREVRNKSRGLAQVRTRVASLVRWYLSVLDPPDNTKKRKRAEESDSDTPEPESDSDDQDAEGEDEDEEPRKAKSKRKAAPTKPKAAAKSKGPPQKKPRIPKVTSAKTGPKATKRTRKPKGGDTGEPFDAEKLAKDTHISGDNPLFSMWQHLLTRVVLNLIIQMPL